MDDGSLKLVEVSDADMRRVGRALMKVVGEVERQARTLHHLSGVEAHFTILLEALAISAGSVAECSPTPAATLDRIAASVAERIRLEAAQLSETHKGRLT